MRERNTSFLERILGEMRKEVARRQTTLPLRELRARLADVPPPRDFRGALAAEGLSLIAEFKRASPSKGPICPDADPAEVVRAYEEGGARAISVLTNGPYFAGSDDDLRRAKGATRLPILRKDFTVEPYQVYEARAIGADAVLLIVAALSDAVLKELLGVVRECGMTALVEVHTAEEIERACACGAEIIGINNRDLHTFETSLETTERLRAHIPPGVLVVSESGISTSEDLRRLRKVGVDAVLVGESLMRRAAAHGKLLRETVRDQVRALLG